MDRGRGSIGWLLVVIAAGFIIFWGIQSASFILAPLLTAMVITIALQPVPLWLTKKGMHPSLALILTIVVVIGVLAGVFLLMLASASRLLTLLPTYGTDLATQPIGDLQTMLQSLLPGAVPEPTAAAPEPTAVEELLAIVNLRDLSGIATALAGVVIRAVTQGFLVLFIFGFMLSILVATPNMTSQRLGIDSAIIERFSEFTREVRQYVTIMTLINFLVAAGNTILLLILGVDFALLWGILSFFLGYIPSVGFWLALIPPVLLAWAEQGVVTALIVFVAYVLINGGVQNIVQPRIMGKGLRLSPLVVFVSVVVWAALLGGLGALIAVPMTLIVQKVLALFDSTRWIADLMSLGAESETSGTPEALDRLKGLAGKAAAAVSGATSQG